MAFIDISRIKDLAFDRFVECTPRLLVVADGSLNFGTDRFGLIRFVDKLRATTIHGMAPIVTTRDRHAAGTDSAFNDLDIGQFDVVFLFGWNSAGDKLSPAAYTKIATFMQGGGGLFATGDHEDMGAGMCGQLPRVRAMRFWAVNETPNIANSTRLTTSLPGPDTKFEFDDQGDATPQRLYANFAIPPDQFIFFFGPSPFTSTRVRSPHPIITMADGSALDVYPDHPHEGECRLSANLLTTFDLAGTQVAEWPGASNFFSFPLPRHVASTMSYGNGFDTGPTGPKDAVVPRAFITLAAYNGHPQNVGRVVTDATWHHYVNVNLNGMVNAGVPNADLTKIGQYWSNLATWLMPAKTRKCLWPWFVFEILRSHQVAEEIRIPTDGDLPVDELQRIGHSITSAINQSPGSVGSDVANDILSAITDPERINAIAREEASQGHERDAGVAATAVVMAVLGASVVALVQDAANGHLEHGAEQFDRRMRDAAQRVSLKVLDSCREELARSSRAIDVVERIISN
jgi:hypothetical protein